jgi:hypothetical protein
VLEHSPKPDHLILHNTLKGVIKMADHQSSKLHDLSNPTSSLGGMNLLTEKEAAPKLKKPVSWMQMARHRGDGPPYLKLGRAIRYDENELIAWVKAQRRVSTSQS